MLEDAGKYPRMYAHNKEAFVSYCAAIVSLLCPDWSSEDMYRKYKIGEYGQDDVDNAFGEAVSAYALGCLYGRHD